MTDRRNRGDWKVWFTDDDHVVAGWMPWDPEATETHLIEFATQRDAIIAQDVLNALEAKPRHD